jgi:hypothetical protein
MRFSIRSRAGFTCGIEAKKTELPENLSTDSSVKINFMSLNVYLNGC